MRLCAQCSHALQQRAKEHHSAFAGRKYCSMACKVEAMRGSGFSLRGLKVEGVTREGTPWRNHKHRASEQIKRAKVGEIVKRIMERRKTA